MPFFCCGGHLPLCCFLIENLGEEELQTVREQCPLLEKESFWLKAHRPSAIARRHGYEDLPCHFHKFSCSPDVFCLNIQIFHHVCVCVFVFLLALKDVVKFPRQRSLKQKPKRWPMPGLCSRTGASGLLSSSLQLAFAALKTGEGACASRTKSTCISSRCAKISLLWRPWAKHWRAIWKVRSPLTLNATCHMPDFLQQVPVCPTA